MFIFLLLNFEFLYILDTHTKKKKKKEPKHNTKNRPYITKEQKKIKGIKESHKKNQNNLQDVHAAAAKSLQLCPTLCDPVDSSPPGSPVPGILQARTLEWVAIAFSNAWKWKVKVKALSCIWLFTTPWTAAYLAPPSMGFSRQEYWSGVPSPSSGAYPEGISKLLGELLNVHISVTFQGNSSDSPGFRVHTCGLRSWLKQGPCRQAMAWIVLAGCVPLDKMYLHL